MILGGRRAEERQLLLLLFFEQLAQVADEFERRS